MLQNFKWQAHVKCETISWLVRGHVVGELQNALLYVGVNYITCNVGIITGDFCVCANCLPTAESLANSTWLVTCFQQSCY